MHWSRGNTAITGERRLTRPGDGTSTIRTGPAQTEGITTALTFGVCRQANSLKRIFPENES